MEIIFLFEMCLGFFIEYTPKDSIYPIRDISKIGQIYLQTQFFYDFLPLIPFPYLL